jgi:DNA-binding XRE family transcriptional regulator
MGGKGSGRKPDLARRRKAAALRARGLSFTEIGRRLGASCQGVRYMLGLVPRWVRPARPDLRCGRCRRAILGSATAGKTSATVYCVVCLARLPVATFAQRLRSLRVARGLTRAALESAAEVAREALARYEQGRSLPRPEIFARLVRVLGVGLTGGNR